MHEHSGIICERENDIDMNNVTCTQMHDIYNCTFINV